VLAWTPWNTSLPRRASEAKITSGPVIESRVRAEIIAKVRAGSGAVQRELARLEASGLVTVRRLGTQKHYQANPDSPLFAELCSIAQKTRPPDQSHRVDT